MLRKIVFTFGIKILVALINLVIVIILSQQIGASGKGEASLIITTIAIINILCNFVGGPTLVYLVPRQNFFQLLLLSYSWSFLVCMGSWIVLTYLSIIPPGFVIHIAVLSFLGSMLSSNLTALLGKEKIISQNLLALLQAILNVGVLLFLFFFLNDKDVYAYIFSLYAAFGAVAVLSFIILIPFFDDLTLKAIPSLLIKAAKIGFYNQAGHIMQFLSLRLSYYILNGYNNEASVGIYSNGVSLAESIWLISNSIAMVQYARIANNDNMEENRKLTLKLIKISLLLCTLAMIPLLALPSAFFVWLFGEEFSGVTTVIHFLAPGIIIYNLQLIISHYFSGTGKYHINTFGNLIGLVVTLILTFLFIPHYGIVQAGIIASCSYASTALFVTLYFLKETGYSYKSLSPDANDYYYLKLRFNTLKKKFR